MNGKAELSQMTARNYTQMSGIEFHYLHGQDVNLLFALVDAHPLPLAQGQLLRFEI